VRVQSTAEIAETLPFESTSFVRVLSHLFGTLRRPVRLAIADTTAFQSCQLLVFICRAVSFNRFSDSKFELLVTTGSTRRRLPESVTSQPALTWKMSRS